MTTATRLHIDEPRWLAGVREDLDRDRNEYARPDDRLAIIEGALDIILTELGHRGRRHACPECGIEHLGPKE